MTHYKALLDNDYVGQWDFPIDAKTGKRIEITVTIDGVPKRYKPARQMSKKMPDGSYAPERIKRLEISLKNARGPIRKKWLSGPATQQVIASLYGNDIEGWDGKLLTLYVDPDVMMGRDKVGGVRVRNVAPTSGPGHDSLDGEPDPEKVSQIAGARRSA